jgi:hypothetical protein
MQHVAEQQPAEGEGGGRAREDGVEGRAAEQREAEEGGIASQHEELAVGEIQHAGDAILEIEADRNQGIDAADDEAPEEQIDQHHSALFT